MIHIRTYETADWPAIEAIHDSARRIELTYANQPEAFLPLKIAAEREGLFEYPGLFVAEQEGRVVGFAACTQEELAWLYVDPAHMRRGVGKMLLAHALHAFPEIDSIEVLKGNTPAAALYQSFGFQIAGTEKGRMPGNEAYPVEVWVLRRTLPNNQA